MALPLIMAGAAAANLIGGMAAGDAAQKAADRAASVQEDMYDKLMEQLQAIGIPSIEAQKILLESPELVGELIPELMGDSAYEQVNVDPRLKDAQMGALSDLRRAAEQGLTAQDLYQRDRLLEEEASRMTSEQRGIEQDMASRGALDSGAQLAMQMQSMQGSADRGQNAALELAAQRQQARQQALRDLGGMSGQMRSQEFGEQSQLASARDEIARMNAGARTGAQQFNLQNKQAIENQRAQTANQQEMYNKQLQQQRYQNQLQKLGVQQGIAVPAAQGQAQAILAGGQGQAQMYSNMGKSVGDVATAYGGYMAKKPGQGQA